MAHDVSVMGAVYREVPSVLLPDQTGTLNQFTDVSDTTATAADVAKGAYFYTSEGVRTAGTSEGGGGGGEQDSGDRTDPIRFFDYDGRLVASYKAVPSAMPDVPTHDRLANGTWNYTLAQVAEQFAAVGACDVGANYDTASGCTEIDVTLDSAHLDPYLCVAVNGTVTVDWGDGSAADTITGTSWTTLYPTQHVYAQAGDYTISIDGAVSFYGNGDYYPAVLRGYGLTSGDRQRDREYCNCVTAVRVAYGSRIGTNAFNSCFSLQSLTIPSGVTSISTDAFYNCYSLRSVTIPPNVTRIDDYAFYCCQALRSVTIPAGVTSISSNAFQNCQALQSVTIPAGVTSIGGSAFYNCYGVYEYHLEPTTPPTLGYNAFGNIVAGTIIYVPKGSLEAYQTASNWSKYKSYMQEEA